MKHTFSLFILFSLFTVSSCKSINDSTKQLDAKLDGPNPRCVGGTTFENESIDCNGARIGLSCNGDNEHQPAVLTLRNASVKNVVIVAGGGSDGINCISGNCTIENTIWEDICEDAASLTKSARSLTIRGGWAYNDNVGSGGKPDKIFQHNAGSGSTFTITDGFIAKGVNGKLWKSCGNCKNNSGPRILIIDNVKIEGKIGAIAGLNINQPYNDVAKISNLYIENFNPKKTKVCRTFWGTTREQGKGDADPIGVEWNTENCQVSLSDVISF